MTHSTLRRTLRRQRPERSPQMGPKRTTVDAILNYSKALRVVDAPPVGKIAVILN